MIEALSLDVSIIIRTMNEGKFIESTLETVREQDFGGDFEILVVDSGSTDSTLEIVKKYDVKLLQIPQEEFTYGRSLNIGASNAKGEFIGNLSAHALPKGRRWLKHLIAGFQDRDVAGVYGKQLSIGRLNPFEALRNELFFGQEKKTFNMKNKEMLKGIHFSNSNCAVRKEVWQRFRFDEEAPWAEDILWSKEVIEAGFSLSYAPNAAVYHTHAVSISKAYRTAKDCAYTLALMNRKRRSISMTMYDVGIFLSLMPSCMFQSVRYMWLNNYLNYLKIAPLYVMSECLGWLVGRIEYRLTK